MPFDESFDEGRFSNPRVATDKHNASVACGYSFENDFQVSKELFALQQFGRDEFFFIDVCSDGGQSHPGNLEVTRAESQVGSSSVGGQIGLSELAVASRAARFQCTENFFCDVLSIPTSTH